MAKTKVKSKAKTRDKDIQELNRAIAALKGSQHNPVNWAAIVSFVGPIIGRLAARYAAGWLASKWNKRATTKIRKELAEATADRMATIFYKQLLK